MIEKRKWYKISNNLREEMSKLDFEEETIEMMTDEWVGQKVFVHNIWNDPMYNQEYATVDLCVEIPLQCLEEI